MGIMWKNAVLKLALMILGKIFSKLWGNASQIHSGIFGNVSQDSGAITLRVFRGSLTRFWEELFGGFWENVSQDSGTTPWRTLGISHEAFSC